MTDTQEPSQDPSPQERGVEPGESIPNTSLGPIPRPYADPDDWQQGYTSL